MNGVELDTATFLRPAWLYAVPLVLLAWVWWRRRGASLSGGWEAEVDAPLRPYVIESAAARRSGWSDWPGHALFTGWLLTLLVLSGPVFERHEVPSFTAPASTVILLDLSRSMRSTDLVPDRIARARFKIDDLLGRGEDDRFALVGFAERPYAISPLTDDVRMLRTFLRSLSPDIVPVQGSRLDLALDHAVELLRNAGVENGSVFLLTDQSPGERDVAAARRAASAGYRLSVLGVGTRDGAPLRDADGRFLTREDGSIVVPRLDADGLERLAAAGDGRWSALTSDDTDLRALWPVRGAMEDGTTALSASGEPSTQRFWIERGPWLLVPLALAALLLFRREAEERA